MDFNAANQAWAEKLGLKYPLLSDTRREMTKAYGVLNDDPAAAIHAMLQLKAGCYELFMVYAQVILRKKDIEAVRPKGPIPGKPGLPL